MHRFVPSTRTILLIAAAEDRRTTTAQQLESLGYDVIALATDRTYEQVIQHRHYDLLLLDLHAAEPQTAQALSRLAADLLAQGTPVVTLAADQFDPKLWTQAMLSQRIDAAFQRGAALDVLAERARHWDGLNVLDPQTALFNRRYFDALLPTELERARRIHQPMTLLLLDLALVPDDLIALWRSISTGLLTSLRQTDLVARYTPSLVAIVLPATDASLARIVAARLQKTLQTRTLPDGSPLTISYGVAAYPQHGTTAATLIAAAQYALIHRSAPVAV